MQARKTSPHYFSSALSWLYRGFDAVATWVTQLSWWKFFLFAILTLTAGAILQEELFSGPGEEYVSRAERDAKRGSDAAILIDESGIRFHPRSRARSGAATPEAPVAPPDASELPVPPDPPAAPAPTTH